MTKKQMKAILLELDSLKMQVVDTLDGFACENTKAYEKLFDELYAMIEATKAK